MEKPSLHEMQLKIQAQGVVPVFNHDDKETAFRVIRTCYAAGLRVFEWTNRGPYAIQLFPELVNMVRTDCPDLLFGVGSLLDEKTALRFISFGIDFMVSPVIDPELAVLAKKKKIMWIPGCGTATEIHQAQKWGASLVKVFPGDMLGPGFVKAVLAPMPWSSIMPTGGVSTDRKNLESWFKAGVKCVGMGSKLFTKELIQKGNEKNLHDKIVELLGIISELR
ncbi:MAG: bifunctional 4-hydroxy-2-oxoglutarate aldolase/2-dehydro-3-deoxy-phosphogluconate aldolase [Bacteroidales bacterium]|nr:bifunctional 4-hydroxy-2-oxoglutarate aldolase/2-dehydro-3-deoxy-phosphogluconate aldolase [Bacteroidales bacterium]